MVFPAGVYVHLPWNLLAILICYHLNRVTCVGVMDSRCTVDSGVSPDMTHCGRFLICVRGVVRRQIECSEGMLFDTTGNTCDLQHRVHCGKRPSKFNGTTSCFMTNIRVTIKVENIAQPPLFYMETTIEAPRQPLENFMLMAAGKDERFRFEADQVEDFGEFVTSINGLRSHPLQLTTWIPVGRHHTQITKGIKEYIPETSEIINFRFRSFAESEACIGYDCIPVKTRLSKNND